MRGVDERTQRYLNRRRQRIEEGRQQAVLYLRMGEFLMDAGLTMMQLNKVAERDLRLSEDELRAKGLAPLTAIGEALRKTAG